VKQGWKLAVSQFHISRGSLEYLGNQRGSGVEHWKYGTSDITERR